MLIKTTTENTSIHFDRFLKSTLARTKNYKILWLMLKAVAVQCSRLIIKHRNNAAVFVELLMSRSKDDIDLEKLITTLWLHYKSCSQRRCFSNNFCMKSTFVFVDIGGIPQNYQLSVSWGLSVQRRVAFLLTYFLLISCTQVCLFHISLGW